MDLSVEHPPQKGFFSNSLGLYLASSTPINQGEENLGSLTVGERFTLADVGGPAVLSRGGEIIDSSAGAVSKAELAQALRSCTPGAECELELGGETYLSLPMETWPVKNAGAGESRTERAYELRGLRSVDAAVGPVQATLRTVFYAAGLTALFAAVGLSAASSRSIVKPLAAVVQHLRASERTGVLPEFQPGGLRVQEIRELAEGFNHAAAAIRQGRDDLVKAYVEFVGSLASALDARDPYTAGHSWRVSEYACAIARAMNLTPDEILTLRVGALLHDIGKIGISDSVLRKPGKLTPEESAIIQEHPAIGRRILEGVHGFQPYLGTVELHHENWDGTGYPRGLKGEETPLAARIVKVADAYDAMTSDRPYRKGISHQEALQVLERFSGTQMDPAVVRVFATLAPGLSQPRTAGQSGTDSLRSLATAVAPESAAVMEEKGT
jgi:HD-GYP domain-containing protein (c-di-GMP phosphodiesterase class II)